MTSVLKKESQKSQNLYQPLVFIPNEGQIDARVRYYAPGKGCSFYFLADKIVFALTEVQPNILSAAQPHSRGTVLELSFVEASSEIKLENCQAGTGKVNYFIGNDPRKWHTKLPVYEKLAYRNVWPGIDLILYSENNQLKYDWYLQPGSRTETIQLHYDGAERLTMSEDGSLSIHYDGGCLTDARPTAYQEIDGQIITVACSFRLNSLGWGAADFGFQIDGFYDPGYPLVIDPAVQYTTYLGGNDRDFCQSIAADRDGNAYVAGQTTSANFPITPGAFDTTFHGFRDAFVTKLSPDGSSLIYSTYLGGINVNEGTGIAVDASGHAYATGHTNSPDFPVTPGAFQTTLGGQSDAFVTKLSADGSSLVYSTYLGGSLNDLAYGIAVNAAGSACVVGETNSTDFPVTAGAFQTALPSATSSGFAAMLSADGSSLFFATYLGGSTFNYATSVALDSASQAYVSGVTTSADFPVTAGAFDTTFNGSEDTFVTKFSADGSSLIYSTYLGGSSFTQALGIAIDAEGSAYVTGRTGSIDFPTTPGAFQTSLQGIYDAFITKFPPDGSSLVYSTYLGGSQGDIANGIAVDGQGRAYVTGDTFSPDFPTTPWVLPSTFNGSQDAFVTILSADGSAPIVSYYLGGPGGNGGRGIALDGRGGVYIAGYTTSASFPVSSGAFQQIYGGGATDGFISKAVFLMYRRASVVLAELS